MKKPPIIVFCYDNDRNKEMSASELVVDITEKWKEEPGLKKIRAVISWVHGYEYTQKQIRINRREHKKKHNIKRLRWHPKKSTLPTRKEIDDLVRAHS